MGFGLSVICSEETSRVYAERMQTLGLSPAGFWTAALPVTSSATLGTSSVWNAGGVATLLLTDRASSVPLSWGLLAMLPCGHPLTLPAPCRRTGRDQPCPTYAVPPASGWSPCRRAQQTVSSPLCCLRGLCLLAIHLGMIWNFFYINDQFLCDWLPMPCGGHFS